MADPEARRVRKRRTDADRSRGAVLDAAIALLGRRPDASIEDIASAAGVVRQTVYAHFPSRSALVGAVLERLTAETAAGLAALDLTTPPADEALRRWLRATWNIIDSYPVLLSPVIAEAAPAAEENERHEPVTAQLIELIRRGRRTGVFDTSSPESWAVAAVIALGHAAGQEVAAGRMSRDDAGAAYRDGVMRLLLNRPAAGNG
ncbi:TetR/AcrR family transcriptional regulator [Actinoplanes sp. NPDC051411]|uniref:TetR/AcrR family transcriptional regulator n=1 Tax=Actinoplanes sp. NPDC051411 TaxID=3155522 RepID=UPI003431255F